MTRTLCVRRVVVRYVLQILFVKNVKAGQMIFVNYIYDIKFLVDETCFKEKQERGSFQS